jgi:hypothetical protein
MMIQSKAEKRRRAIGALPPTWALVLDVTVNVEVDPTQGKEWK